MKSSNILSIDEAGFGGDTGGYAGWEISDGTGQLVRINNAGPYNLSIPDLLSVDAESPGNVLAVRSSSTDPIEISSGFFDVTAGSAYSISITAGVISSGSRELSWSIDYYTSDDDSAIITRDLTTNPIITLPNIDTARFVILPLLSLCPNDAVYGKLKVNFSDGADVPGLAALDIVILYNPRVIEYSNTGQFTEAVYSSIPEFMRLDDENIQSIVSSYQSPFPLRSYIESLCARLDAIDETAFDFTYTRASYGDYSESTLTDPLTAPAEYLQWLAVITATTLISSSSGFTPWAALESYDGDEDLIPGEWEDLELLSSWALLEALNPDFFDTTLNYRNLISTGFSGLNAGTKSAIEKYLKTLLTTNDPENAILEQISSKADNPFKSLLLVDPNYDPDPGGALLSQICDISSGAGVSTETTNYVEHSGRSFYNMDELLATSSVEDDPVGSSIYGGNFITDSSHHGQNLVLNSSGDISAPDLGGGIGAAHYEDGSSFITGDGCYWTTSSTSAVDFSNLTDGFDIIVEVSHVHDDPAEAAVGTLGSSSTSDWWKWRNKRLLVAGSGSSGNDWAILVVSGPTVEADEDSHIMYVEGFNTPTSTNYVVSDPVNIDGDTAGGSAFVRVNRSSDDTVTIYFQKSLHGNWKANQVGSGTIVSTISSAVDPSLQIGGAISGYADQIACEFRRIMVFNPANSSLELVDDLSAAVAVVNGEQVLNDGVYDYSPDIDVDFSGLGNYTESFVLSTGETVTLTSPVSNDNDLYVFRTNESTGTIWHFGYAASGGDTLTATGLDSGTTYYPHVHEVNEDGTITTISGSSFTGVTSYDFTSSVYGGKDIASIEVATSSSHGSGTSVGPDTVRYFDAATLPAGETTGSNWALTRSWPSSTVAYTPSQPIDTSYFSTYESKVVVKRKLHLENYSSFSVSGKFRRHWTDATGTTFNIYNIVGEEGHGFTLQFDGPDIVASYTDGTLSETVSWEESPVYGDWHVYVIRRNAVDGIELFVDGVSVATADAANLETFPTVTNVCEIGEGGANEFNARLEVASLSVYDRYLSDLEILLLNSQLSG